MPSHHPRRPAVSTLVNGLLSSKAGRTPPSAAVLSGRVAGTTSRRRRSVWVASARSPRARSFPLVPPEPARVHVW